MASSIYYEIDKSIIQRLQILESDNIWIRGTPETPKQWSLEHPGGLITVVLHRFTPEGNDPIGNVSQFGNLQFFVQIELNGLREGASCYNFIEAVVSCLIGWCPNRGGKVRCQGWEFLGAIENEDRYAMRINFEAEMVVLAKVEEDPSALLERVSFRDINGRYLADTKNSPFKELN